MNQDSFFILDQHRETFSAHEAYLGNIRAFRREDLGQVMQIWLDANREAHPFIPGSYWEGNLAFVEAALPKAEVFVWEAEESKELQGFLGIDGDYIAGIFVRSKARSQGIGRMLLEYAKGRKSRLTLHVYQKNERAVRFYEREGFQIGSQGVDAQTGEEEYEMIWESLGKDGC